MGTLYWVSEKKRYQMGNVGNLIILVSFSFVVLEKPPEFNWATDNDPAIKTTDNDLAIKTVENDRAAAIANAYCKYVAQCPTRFSSLCLCCTLGGFLNRCNYQCRHPNICDVNLFQNVVQAAESRKLADNTYSLK